MYLFSQLWYHYKEWKIHIHSISEFKKKQKLHSEIISVDTK